MIIFLNGCSSSGKTMVAKAIQHLSCQPWLHLGIDTFFHMMPSKYVGFGEKASQGYHFIPEVDEEGPIMKIESGPVGKSVTNSIPNVVQSLANDGHHIIVDEVLFSDAELENYVKALKGHTVYFIGVVCDLKTLQERETLREDRALGLARDQIAFVHSRSRPYDVTLDTTTMSAFDCAKEILDYMDKNPQPQAFKDLS